MHSHGKEKRELSSPIFGWDSIAFPSSDTKVWLFRTCKAWFQQTIQTQPKEEKPFETPKNSHCYSITSNLSTEIFVICIILSFIALGLLNSSLLPFLGAFLVIKYIDVNIEYLAIDW